MKKDNLHVDIIPVLVQKVLQEVRDTLQSNVSTDHNVPVQEKAVRANQTQQHDPILQSLISRGTEAATRALYISPLSPSKPSTHPQRVMRQSDITNSCSEAPGERKKAYGCSPDAAQNPIKSPATWPSGFMHLTISDIMLVLKCYIIKSLLS